MCVLTSSRALSATAPTTNATNMFTSSVGYSIHRHDVWIILTTTRYSIHAMVPYSDDHSKRKRGVQRCAHRNTYRAARQGRPGRSMLCSRYFSTKYCMHPIWDSQVPAAKKRVLRPQNISFSTHSGTCSGSENRKWSPVIG